MKKRAYKQWCVCTQCRRLFKLSGYWRFKCVSENRCVAVLANLVALSDYLQAQPSRVRMIFAECADSTWEELPECAPLANPHEIPGQKHAFRLMGGVLEPRDVLDESGSTRYRRERKSHDILT